MPCTKCESLPEATKFARLLFLWPPTAHCSRKLLKRSDTEINPEANCLSLTLASEGLADVLAELQKVLSPDEVRDTKAVLLNEQRSLSLADIAKSQSLAEIAKLSEVQWLCDILREKRLTSFLQPIVYANNTDVAFGHEALLRAWDTDDELVNPGKLFQAAIDGGLLFNLDREARASAVRKAAETNLQSKLFINFTPTSIYDPENCLRATLSLIDEYQFERSNIVFEVIETEKITDVKHLAKVLKYYRDNGFQVALDDLGGGYSALSMLPELSPDYVKIDRSLITNIHANETQAVICKRIMELCHDLDIKVVAEGIEKAAEEAVLLELKVDFLQGYYYGKPQTLPMGEMPLGFNAVQHATGQNPILPR